MEINRRTLLASGTALAGLSVLRGETAAEGAEVPKDAVTATAFMKAKPDQVEAVKEALDAHGKTPHMKALGGKLKDKTDKGGGLVFYELLK